MASLFRGLEVEERYRPVARAYDFDLEDRLSSVVALEARVPDDAFTAHSLGTERFGNGTVINADGLVLTIGYLVTEAEHVVLTANDGRRSAAHVLGIDQASGFGLVQALEPLSLPPAPIGNSRRIGVADPVIAAGAGGRDHAAAARLLARAPFAGYWEYFLEEALFTGPGHPHWSGAALFGPVGELVGVGSLRMEQGSASGETRPINMFVPAELLPPVLDDLVHGRPANPPRPWLGIFTQAFESHIVVLDVSPGGPAARAELRRGDIIQAIAGKPVSDTGEFYTALWALGPAGVTVPLSLVRDGDAFDVEIRSADRASRLKKRRFN
jgi:S1-C subfamily serine protease